MEPSFQSGGPITQADLDRTIDWMFRMRNRYPEPASRPGESIDFALLHQHGIGYFWESPDLVLFSADGLRRAREVGAVVRLEAEADGADHGARRG